MWNNYMLVTVLLQYLVPLVVISITYGLIAKVSYVCFLSEMNQLSNISFRSHIDVLQRFVMFAFINLTCLHKHIYHIQTDQTKIFLLYSSIDKEIFVIYHS